MTTFKPGDVVERVDDPSELGAVDLYPLAEDLATDDWADSVLARIQATAKSAGRCEALEEVARKLEGSIEFGVTQDARDTTRWLAEQVRDMLALARGR